MVGGQSDSFRVECSRLARGASHDGGCSLPPCALCSYLTRRGAHPHPPPASRAAKAEAGGEKRGGAAAKEANLTELGEVTAFVCFVAPAKAGDEVREGIDSLREKRKPDFPKNSPV